MPRRSTLDELGLRAELAMKELDDHLLARREVLGQHDLPHPTAADAVERAVGGAEEEALELVGLLPHDLRVLVHVPHRLSFPIPEARFVGL